ncbi:MAG: peptidoglycan-binding domain-containing protein, partial [Gammaproteobacteria bacterium]|nr:peptidoglycan-binding domain-containing protein [Gammaproteobacteria bacterium]
VLEPAADAAHRLLVLAMHEHAPHAAARAPALTVEEALALLANAQAALGAGRAAHDEYRGPIAHDRARNRLRFTGADARARPRTMTVFTVPGLAIVESGAASARRSDGAYRCAEPPQPPRALLPAHCAERRAGRVDLEAFPAPRAEVALIQRALERSGMTPGPIDGIFGPRTLGALERWSGRTARGSGRILAYETLCPLIGTPRATNADDDTAPERGSRL